MSETLKMTAAELDAMRLNALINGADLSKIDVNDDFDIEIIDKKPKNKTITKNLAPAPKKIDEIPLLDLYKNLRNGKVDVKFNQHDIHYKDQFWDIPPRTVEYQIELVKIPKIAADISQKFYSRQNKEAAKAAAKARAGETRYYSIRTYESVLSSIVTIAYAKVTPDDKGKLKSRLAVEKEALSKSNANVNKIIKNIDDAMKSLLANKEK